jgi:N-ethylmaleimide reductase
MLFDSFQLRSTPLSNRIVMSPLTRSRASDNNTANSLMATYYAQRASAGLIITEGTSPSPNGLGYARIPGLFNDAQVRGWKLVTDAVHAKGGKIVVQLMHTGRVSHQANLPAGAQVLGPSPETCPGEMWTDTQGSQPHTQPRAMTEADIQAVVGEYATAARLAIQAGFDGIELHAANGYLLEQFLNANINRRTDGFGGNAEGRNRLVLEVARAAAKEIGAERVGIRLSPHGVVNSAGAFEGADEQYLDLVKQLSTLGLMYVHVLDHSAMGTPPVPAKLKADLRAAFNGPFILAGGLSKASAEQALSEGLADLTAMGRAFIANPDLVERLRQDASLNAPAPETFYTPGAEGYTDYPTLAT